MIAVFALLAAAPTARVTAGPTGTAPAAAPLTLAGIRATLRRLWDADTPPLPATLEELQRAQPTPVVSPVPGLNAYLAGLRGRPVRDWQGWVLAVLAGAGGSYTVTVDMDEYGDIPSAARLKSGSRRSNAVDVLLTNLSAAQAVGLQPDRRLAFSGQIADLREPTSAEGDADPANADLLIVLAAATVRPLAGAPPDLSSLASLRDATLTLEYPACGMDTAACYAYHMIVHGDGTVIYRESDQDLAPPGAPPFEKQYTVAPAKIRALFALCAQVGYFTVQQVSQASLPTDTFPAITSLTAGGVRREILNWDFDPQATKILAALDDALDNIVDSDQTYPPTPAVPQVQARYSRYLSDLPRNPAANGDLAYFTAYPDQLYAVDLAHGQTRWTFQYTGGAGAAPPLRVGNQVLLGVTTSHYDYDSATLGPRRIFYALDAGTGRAQWSFTAPDEQASAPVVADGQIYFATGDEGQEATGRSAPGHLYVLDLPTGRLDWSFPLTASVYAPPVVGKDLVYLSDGAGGVAAVDIHTHSLRWRADLGLPYPPPAFALSGNLLYVTAGSSLWALDARTGATRWRQDLPLGFFDFPVQIDGRLYVSVNADIAWHKHRPEANRANYLLELDPATGRERRRIPLPECCVRQAPLVAGRHIYLSTSYGVYALDRATGAGQWWLPLEPDLEEELTFVGGYIAPMRGETVYPVAAEAPPGPVPGMPTAGQAVPWGPLGGAGVLLLLAGLVVRRVH